MIGKDNSWLVTAGKGTHEVDQGKSTMDATLTWRDSLQLLQLVAWRVLLLLRWALRGSSSAPAVGTHALVLSVHSSTPHPLPPAACNGKVRSIHLYIQLQRHHIAS